MTKRLLFSALLALVFCGISFYLACFAALIYAAASGPLNPANAARVQAALRHVALPFCLAVGLAAFAVCFRRFRSAGPGLLLQRDQGTQKETTAELRN
jgi:hypothetical protein